jgi:hypothetical protein
MAVECLLARASSLGPALSASSRSSTATRGTSAHVIPVASGLSSPLSRIQNKPGNDAPAMMERDPDVVLGWLAQRVSAEHLPAEPVVLEFWPYEHDRRYWLVLQEHVEPYGCLIDPLLDAGRYVYVRCALPTLLALACGRQGWPDAFGDGSLTATGETALCRRVTQWFTPFTASITSARG